MRCQYCGKNLWPLRGLFDEDFCSRDHRQRYHERVRKALEHMPKAQATPRATGIAGFQFEKPRAQEPAVASHSTVSVAENPAAPAIPSFAPAAAPAAFAPASFNFASPAPAAGDAPRKTDVAAEVIAPQIVAIDSLRERLHEVPKTAAGMTPMVDRPVKIPPQPGNMALKASARWSPIPAAFEELNNVYLRVPNPELEVSLPAGNSLPGELTPIATTARARHSATAGPAGAGRLEFFPMQPLSGAAIPATALQEPAFQSGEGLWLEDPLSWSVPVSLAPTRSALAMLPVADRDAALAHFRNASPASAASAMPVEWPFATTGVETDAFRTATLAMASPTVIEFPAPRDLAAQAVSDDTAYFDAATFALWMPEMTVEFGDMDLLTGEPADLTPEQSGASETPRGTSWFAMETDAVMPSSSPELTGTLAEPRVGADLVAKSVPSQARNGANSISAPVPVSMPNRMVRLKQGPEFFAAEPVVADSVARPVSARRGPFTVGLALPEIQAAESTIMQPAALEYLVPGGFAGEAALSAGSEVIDTTSVQMPEIEAARAEFGQGSMEKIQVRFRDSGERSPHHFGWMEPQLALQLPEMRYEEYPLALKVSVPEPRTVTVFETATEDAHGKVVSISESRSKRMAVPSYIKGMAAGLMLASFLWFGSSSIKSEGITMRPGDLIRLTIQRRAVYETGDNFHAGLASWEGGKNFAKSWIYDKEGFVRPGHLAIYKPSRDMTDYKLEFLTEIERKGVGWVVRAADEQNYYAMKLAVTEPGPRPLVALVRYTVIDGKKEARGETPLAVMMHNNRPYRVQVDVKGSQFVTFIEGQPVDTWSDDRIKSGGVGFFAEGSEKARLYWMKVTKNNDFLGKLCSILVPKES